MVGSIAVVCAMLLALPACRKSETPPSNASSSTSPAMPTLRLEYEPQPIGEPMQGRPWITFVAVDDLDGDGLLDVLVCDAQANQLRWIRQQPKGVYTEQTIGDVVAPAHVEACDVYRHGRHDLLVASMGQIFPTNDRIGSVVIFENLGGGKFARHVVGDHMARVTDVRGADLLGNGQTQLVVGCFGYDQGETLWLENKGDWKFERHVVNTQSGCIHTPVADFNGNGRLGFAALISQEWEEVHLFENAGGGNFQDRIVWGSTNEDYGSSGLTLADVNRDGRPDLVYTNGDAFDYARPGPRPWHGIQWIENRGNGQWAFHRVGDFPGGYSPQCVDLNGDGKLDLVAVSAFNDWSNPNAVSMMAWINDGHESFTPLALAHAPTHLVALAAADMDGDGIPELITGGFHAYPPWDRMSRVTLWNRKLSSGKPSTAVPADRATARRDVAPSSTPSPSPPMNAPAEAATREAIPPGIDPEQMRRGERVYLTVCFACHQPHGEGLPGIFPPLARSDFLRADKTRAIRAVANGLTGVITVNGANYNNIMPPQTSQLSTTQLSDALTFVMNSWGNNLGAVSADEVMRAKSSAPVQ